MLCDMPRARGSNTVLFEFWDRVQRHQRQQQQQQQQQHQQHQQRSTSSTSIIAAREHLQHLHRPRLAASLAVRSQPRARTTRLAVRYLLGHADPAYLSSSSIHHGRALLTGWPLSPSIALAGHVGGPLAPNKNVRVLGNLWVPRPNAHATPVSQLSLPSALLFSLLHFPIPSIPLFSCRVSLAFFSPSLFLLCLVIYHCYYYYY